MNGYSFERLQTTVDPVFRRTLPVVGELVELFCTIFGEQYISGTELVELVDAPTESAVFVCRDVHGTVIGGSVVHVMNDSKRERFVERWEPVTGVLEGCGRVVNMRSAAVHADHRGKGLGWQLAVSRLEWAKSQNVDLAVATSWRSGSHESFRLWKKLGFVHAGDIESYWSDGRTGECVLCGWDCVCTASLLTKELRMVLPVVVGDNFC